MSLTAALGIAKSGLSVTAVRADMVSRNIANAGTEGFSRKSERTVSMENGAVKVGGFERQVDGMLSRLDRSNVSRMGALQTMVDGMKAYTDFLGQPSDKISPAALMGDLKAAFVTLNGAVSEGSAQVATVTAARNLTSNLRSLSATLTSIGNEVEMNIRYEVADLNNFLSGIAKLNRQMLAESAGTSRMVEYKDHMDRLLQSVAGVLDLQTTTDANGIVSVLTGGGVELVTGPDIHDVAFDAATGRLTAGDVDMTPGMNNRSFSEGSLAGLFSLRNDTIPGWSSELDTLAAALVDGFETVPLDAGLGLFTDDGGPYDPVAIDGLASRIAINSAADPDQGGDPRLLQNGGNPALPAGNTSVADAMLALFNTPTGIVGRDFGESAGLTDMATNIVASQQKLRADTEANSRSASTAAATISASRENLQGVDVDDELQKLLLVEQSYAANAKVLTAVSGMLDSLINVV